jgi:hypothetical protein
LHKPRHRLRRRVAVLTLVAVATAGGATAVAVSNGRRANPLDKIPAQRLPPAKRAALAQAAAAATRPSSSGEPVPPSPRTIVATRNEGINFDAHDGPFASEGFHVQDVYQGPLNGTWYLVFAGQADPEGKPAGTLRIYSGPVDLADGPPVNSVGDFSQAGTADLKIIDVNQATLSLVDPTTDQTFYFDLATREFTGGGSAPTATGQ